MVKIIMKNVFQGLSVCLLCGCTMGTSQDMGNSKTIKIIRENPNNKTTVKQVMVSTGKIEHVDYNSSIIAPEREGYKPKRVKETTQSKSKMTSRIGNKVTNEVSSSVNQVKSKANSTVDSAMDNALNRLFR